MNNSGKQTKYLVPVILVPGISVPGTTNTAKEKQEIPAWNEKKKKHKTKTKQKDALRKIYANMQGKKKQLCL